MLKVFKKASAQLFRVWYLFLQQVSTTKGHIRATILNNT